MNITTLTITTRTGHAPVPPPSLPPMPPCYHLTSCNRVSPHLPHHTTRQSPLS